MVLAFVLAAQVALAQEIPNDFMVTLQRTACFGTCHVYTVTIDARGNVTYEGRTFVRVTGTATDTVPLTRVRELLAGVERIGFFQLRDGYRTIRNPDGSETVVTDLPTTFVTVTRGGKTKRVEDYVGAPESLREFERQIDEATRSRRWTRIDEPTLRLLVAAGQTFAPAERTQLFKDALSYDDVDVVEALLQMGKDPNRPIGEAEVLPLTMVRSAAAARTLLSAGASPVARDTSALEAARKGKEAEQTRLPLPSDGAPPFVRDFDAVIALLEAATAKKR